MRLIRFLPGFVLLMLTPLSAQVLVNEKRTWKAASNVSGCEGCKTIPVTIPGPGILTIRLQMEPYQHREFPNYSESIVTHEGLPNIAKLEKSTFNGKSPVPPSAQLVNKPADLVYTWRYTRATPGKFDLHLRNPVKVTGGGMHQRAANARLTVTFQTTR